MVAWLQSWDATVFPAAHKAKAAAAKSSTAGPFVFGGQNQQHAHGNVNGNHSGGGQFRGGNLSSIPKPGYGNANSGGFGGFQHQHQHQQVNDDGTARPFHKVLLLAGPPGCGKTTLAHIAAAHCGYRALEINARYAGGRG